MSRDVGTGIYNYPDGTPGNPGQTVFSARYNTFINDLKNTLNQKLPINMGGTNADDAAEARDNLDAEVAGAQVTDYNTHVFENGSFWSADGATGGPLGSSGIFSGTCHKVDGNSINLMARQYGIGDGAPVYSRVKNGTWGAWVVQGEASNDTRYVNATGDTMTGTLTIDSANPVMLLRGPGGHILRGTDALARARWEIQVGDGATETGSNNGSNFVINRFDDGGAYSGTPLQISRSGGVTTLAGNVIVNGTTDGLTVNVPAGQNARTIYAVAGARTWAVGTVAGGDFQIADNTAPASRLLINSAGAVSLFGSLAVPEIMQSFGYRNRSGTSGSYGSTYSNFMYSGGLLQAWVDGTNLGNVTISSDYRIKKDVLDLPGSWDKVKALRPIKYTQAEFTPPSALVQATKTGVPFVPADNIERWGFIAHELQATLVESAATGVKDAPDTIQSPNPWTLIAALTKALQEAMARIEALEAAQATP